MAPTSSSTDHSISEGPPVIGQGENQIHEHKYKVELGRGIVIYLTPDIPTFPQPQVFTIVGIAYIPTLQLSNYMCTTRNEQGNAYDLSVPVCHCGHANPTASVLNNIFRQGIIGRPSGEVVGIENGNPSFIPPDGTGASSSSLSLPYASSSNPAPPANSTTKIITNIQPDGTRRSVTMDGNSLSRLLCVPLNSIPDIMDIETFRAMLPIARRTGPTDSEDEDFESVEDVHYLSDNSSNEEDDDAYDGDEELTYEDHMEIAEMDGEVPGGINQEQIKERMKVWTYGVTKSKLNWNTIKCCICQAKYKKNENLGELDCDHIFHSWCIQDWLMVNNTCPICKQIGLRAPN